MYCRRLRNKVFDVNLILAREVIIQWETIRTFVASLLLHLPLNTSEEKSWIWYLVIFKFLCSSRIKNWIYYLYIFFIKSLYLGEQHPDSLSEFHLNTLLSSANLTMLKDIVRLNVTYVQSFLYFITIRIICSKHRRQNRTIYPSFI